MKLESAIAIFSLAGLLFSGFPADGADAVRGPTYGSPGSTVYGNGLTGGGTQIPNGVLEYYHSLGWLKSAAAKLEETPAGRSPEGRQSLQQIQSDATFLQQKWLDWPRLHPNQAPYSTDIKLDPYFRAVQGATKELKAAKGSDLQMLEMFKNVAADLHAKAENCRHSKDGLGKEIKVTVHTKKGTQELAGYEVWCVPMALVSFQDEHIRFPKLSSPTVLKSLAPGRYGMWLQRDKEKTPLVAQTIGGHGETELEMDLSVPAETAQAR